MEREMSDLTFELRFGPQEGMPAAQDLADKLCARLEAELETCPDPRQLVFDLFGEMFLGGARWARDELMAQLIEAGCEVRF